MNPILVLSLSIRLHLLFIHRMTGEEMQNKVLNRTQPIDNATKYGQGLGFTK